MVWAVRTGEGPSVAWWAIEGTLLVKMELGRSGGENLLHNLRDSDSLGERLQSTLCLLPQRQATIYSHWFPKDWLSVTNNRAPRSP